MFKRVIVACLLAIMTTVILGETADARKRIRLPFIVGGGGGGGTIVKVVDFPDSPLLRRKDGKYIDLGYKFGGKGGDAWIGYIGSSRRYLPLSDNMLKIMLAIGGLKKLPPIPERSSSGFGGIGLGILMLLGMMIMVFSFIGKMFGGTSRLVTKSVQSTVEANVPYYQKSDPDAIPRSMNNAYEAMMAAAESKQTTRNEPFAPPPQATSTGFARQAKPPSNGNRAFGQARASFGQRGN